MAATTFPTWAYQNVAPYAQQQVTSQAALTALGSNYSTTPSALPGTIAPSDPGFTSTDIRLQQIMVEMKILTQMFAQANPGMDDPQVLRTDVIATDAALAS